MRASDWWQPFLLTQPGMLWKSDVLVSQNPPAVPAVAWSFAWWEGRK
jgi:hypothetical protein